jgi:hypothetical protein
VSILVDRAIDAAGLADVLAARRAGTLGDAHVQQLRSTDLLALGALADRIRAEEVGPEVRIYTHEVVHDGAGRATVVTTFPHDDQSVTGLELLREIAIARVTGPSRMRIRVDWVHCGLELAQVALGFGADELAGVIASKRGLPIAEGALAGVGKRSSLEPAKVVKERELAGFIQRAGRRPIFVRSDGTPAALGEASLPQESP